MLLGAKSYQALEMVSESLLVLLFAREIAAIDGNLGFTVGYTINARPRKRLLQRIVSKQHDDIIMFRELREMNTTCIIEETKITD